MTSAGNDDHDHAMPRWVAADAGWGHGVLKAVEKLGVLANTGGTDVFATVTIEQQLRTPRGPTTAVYITWDTHGRCRYVGSVRRPRSRAAVRARLAEHLRTAERRGTWYAVTVLPVRADLSLEVVRQCEGIVARRLSPVDGSAHPVPLTMRSLGNLVAPQLVGTLSGAAFTTVWWVLKAVSGLIRASRDTAAAAFFPAACAAAPADSIRIH
jgi:hypothetical protein